MTFIRLIRLIRLHVSHFKVNCGIQLGPIRQKVATVSLHSHGHDMMSCFPQGVGETADLSASWGHLSTNLVDPSELQPARSDPPAVWHRRRGAFSVDHHGKQGMGQQVVAASFLGLKGVSENCPQSMLGCLC